jgi:hypothetical protein
MCKFIHSRSAIDTCPCHGGNRRRARFGIFIETTLCLFEFSLVNEAAAETGTDAGFGYRHFISFLPLPLPLNPSGGETMVAVTNGGVRVLDGEHSLVGGTSSRRRGTAEGDSRA